MNDLYDIGSDTLVSSWQAYARGSKDATVQRQPGVAVAIFPHPPERGVYNNALLSRGLDARGRSDALTAMETAYAGAGIDRFAAWVHESDHALRTDLEQRGYSVDTSTRAMGMPLDEVRQPLPDLDIGPAQWSEYLLYEGLAPNFLAMADHAAFHVLGVREDGELIAAALAYDVGTDCGIYNVGTVERARRRGLGSAITLAQLYAARDRGRRTASLQATPMAESLYGRLGFRDLGRIIEYVPP